MDPKDVEALKKLMRNAQVAGKGQWLGEGRHFLEVKLAKCQRTEISGKFKETYLIEFTVLASTNSTHEVGSTRTYAENPDNLGWDGRFKGCLIALLGENPNKDASPELSEAAANMVAMLRYDEYRVQQGIPENFLVGKKVYCEGIPGKARSGQEITHKNWTPYVEAPATPAAT